jgi:hypothetical protein
MLSEKIFVCDPGCRMNPERDTRLVSSATVASVWSSRILGPFIEYHRYTGYKLVDPNSIDNLGIETGFGFEFSHSTGLLN